jgi:Aminoglycoside-2''-adenylyltransferase
VSRPELAAEDILAALNQHGVEYVIIGALAAIAQGAPIEATHDVDVTPRRDRSNLRRLPKALEELGAGIRVNDLDEGLHFAHDATSLAQMSILKLTCAAGDFNLVFTPAAAPAG